jgi:DNA repair protein RadC
MASADSTPGSVPGSPRKLPYFALCEKSGRYRARRSLTPEQIVRAANVALAQRYTRGVAFGNPDLTADYLAVHYSDRPAEVFTCLFLDNKHRLLAIEDLFHGTIDGASVYPHEIARRCLAHNAAAVFLAHNHPSGVTTPSPSDLSITAKIKDTLVLLDVRVLDHFIVGGGTAASFAAAGLLDASQRSP